MSVKSRSRRTALSAPLALATVAAIPAWAKDTRSAAQLLQAFTDALAAHDMKTVRALYVDDGYVNHQALVASPPSSINGADAAVAYFKKRIEAFPDLRVTSDVSLITGDMIAANLIWTGTHKGEYLGVPATGKHVTFNSTDIMKVRDGRFAEHWGAADLYGLLAQLKA